MSDNTQTKNAASGSNATRNRRSNKKAASNTGKIIVARSEEHTSELQSQR